MGPGAPEEEEEEEELFVFIGYCRGTRAPAVKLTARHSVQLDESDPIGVTRSVAQPQLA